MSDLHSEMARQRSVVSVAVAAVCAFEVVAELINDALDDDVVPSLWTRVSAVSWRSVSRRLVPPPPARLGAALAGGYVVGMALTRVRGRRRA